MSRFTRREFLDLSVSGLLVAAHGFPLNASPRFRSTPFTLGIASGDPLPDSIVLWTRLATSPLDPGGGMDPERVTVRWELARDERFTTGLRSGTVVASPEWGHAVHVDARGLSPATTYWYRFRVGDWESPVGRTRTAPAANALPDRLRFAFVSCQRWEHGYFTAYRHLAAEDLDLVLHLGDYIYEYGTPEKYVRRVEGAETMTLEQYRQRYAQYRTDSDLQDAHRIVPFVVAWDDHEVDNDYASDVPEDDTRREAFLRRRAAAYQAYYEHMPIRRHRRPAGPDMAIYRTLPYGRLAAFQVLDTRQYRTDQPCGTNRSPLCDAARDPQATILGAAQRRGLFDRLDRSAARWNVLAQQVLMGQVDLAAGPPVEFSMDKWSAYQADRDAVLDFFAQRRPANPIVLTGDIHSNWVCDLQKDPFSGRSPVVGTEFVCTSISSGGDGEELPQRVAAYLPDNPHVRFFNGQRGYVSCTVTPDRWQSDYRIVPYVTRPDAPVKTAGSFVVENGKPGAQKA